MKPVIYQLLPRLFGNTNAHCVTGGTIEQNGCGKLRDITTDVLHSLVDLGVTHVWYTGVIRHATQTDYSPYGIPRNHPAVVKGHAGSPYAIVDYYDIDPDLAIDIECRQQEFNALVQRTHAAGLRVLIDFVPNHVAREYHSIVATGMPDLGAADDHDLFFGPNNNFYYITGEAFAPSMGCGDYAEFPARATGNDCFNAHPCEHDWYETIKLNYGIDPRNGSRHFSPVPDTWHKMLHIILYWADRGIDGLRCDMAHMVPVEFWHWAIAKVKRRHPGFVFIAEIYDVSLYDSYLNHGGFDYLYDKVTLYDTLMGVTLHGRSTHELTGCWQAVNVWRDRLLHFMENHDEQRLASKLVCADWTVARAALVVSATIDTCPMMVYNGQELGEKGDDQEGYSGPDGRTTIFDYWSMSSVRRWLVGRHLTGRHRVRDYYKRVLRLCNSEPAIACGQMFDLMYANAHLQRQYAFLRHSGHDLLLVVANFDSAPSCSSVVIPGHAIDHLGLPPGDYAARELLHRGRQVLTLRADSRLSINVGAHDAVVWKISLK